MEWTLSFHEWKRKAFATQWDKTTKLCVDTDMHVFSITQKQTSSLTTFTYKFNKLPIYFLKR